MEAYRDHAAKHLDGRLNLPDARLVRPTREVGTLDSPIHDDDVVLVPEKRPVGSWHFVEENGADGKDAFAKKGGRIVADARIPCEFADLRRTLQKMRTP